MQPTLDDDWQWIRAHVADTEALDGVLGVLEWDQQVCMPDRGGAHRGAHLALLSALRHQRMVDTAFADRLHRLGEAVDQGAASEVQAAAHRVLSRERDRAVKVPERLVKAQAEARARAFGSWMAARKARSFAPFQADLEEVIALVRELASCLGEADHPYDHLLQEFDPGVSTAGHSALFARLGQELGTFVDELRGRPGPEPLEAVVDLDGLDRVNRRVLQTLGFDLERGRLDPAQHPFTVGIGPLDVRLTTHSYAEDLLGTLHGTVHECGHGLYEQGLPQDLGGTGLGRAAGVGLHESQSRFWENFIGGSLPFMEWLVGVLREELPANQWDAGQLYGATNRVAPSLVRVKADEATYNLHIIVRFELERALIEGSLEVAELPRAWDEAYERVVGIRPPDVVDGVLQDVHWCSGLFGYFPTYTVGNLYAASFGQALVAEVPGVWEEVARGEFGSVLAWLREKVHRRGAMVEPEQVLRDAVGERDLVADLMAHLRGRHGALYGLA